jgi:hypothetical protein
MNHARAIVRSVLQQGEKEARLPQGDKHRLVALAGVLGCYLDGRYHAHDWARYFDYVSALAIGLGHKVFVGSGRNKAILGTIVEILKKVRIPTNLDEEREKRLLQCLSNRDQQGVARILSECAHPPGNSRPGT